MPFDGTLALQSEDLVKLRVALDGVRNQWAIGKLGLAPQGDHCALGWLLVATDWDKDEATRLAIDYVWPALPPKAQGHDGKLRSIYSYNDNHSHKSIVDLFTKAVELAEEKVLAVR